MAPTMGPCPRPSSPRSPAAPTRSLDDRPHTSRGSPSTGPATGPTLCSRGLAGTTETIGYARVGEPLHVRRAVPRPRFGFCPPPRGASLPWPSANRSSATRVKQPLQYPCLGGPSPRPAPAPTLTAGPSHRSTGSSRKPRVWPWHTTEGLPSQGPCWSAPWAARRGNSCPSPAPRP